METKNCKICESSPNNFKKDPCSDIFFFTCPQCGYYQITEEAFEDINLESITEDNKTLFSGYVRNNSTIENPLFLNTEMLSKIPEIVLPYKRLTVMEKVDSVLKYLGNTAKTLTDFVDIYLNDYVRFYLFKPNSLVTIIHFLHKQKYIRIQDKTDHYTCLLTIEGWGKYEKLKEINVYSKKVFVAFEFNTDFAEDLFKTIQSACYECNEFNAVKSDPSQHDEKICDKIIVDIKESRFIVADFTGQNQGVYYEAGYAMGLGIPVIRTCREDEVDDKKLHFDTRQYPHIPWGNMVDLKKQLIAKIKRIV